MCLYCPTEEYFLETGNSTLPFLVVWYCLAKLECGEVRRVDIEKGETVFIRVFAQVSGGRAGEGVQAEVRQQRFG